ncbi:ROK family protein [Gracilibacillus alcaliphilus]|uniref:ROK family protein n=1 Tax=Gracilibacillus alcaliphilus TaxID=1401441 RepID=UPI00195CF5D9|nr:ROK family protein [Gracilibacillus alcaliphilus]MBM7677127.1 putative NBD/HSP70 family sugar kinase [Gracilibacillus alcaliphilus]
MRYLSVDIGGTFIKYGILDETERMIFQDKVKTKTNIDDAILRQVSGIIEGQLARYQDFSGIGISTAGIVDRDSGVIIYAGPTIPNYTGTPIKAYLENKFHLPVCVENDVNAALLGEIWKGAARNKLHVFCITLGTGIGGAYYHQQLTDGYHLQGNAVGYMLFDPETQMNYEDRASTSALNRLITTSLGENYTAEQVFAEAKRGDQVCHCMIQSWAKEVARGIAQIILIKDPSLFIIGGGISQQGDYLLTILKQQLQLFLPPDFLKTELKLAELYNDAALYGAIFPFIKQEGV